MIEESSGTYEYPREAVIHSCRRVFISAPFSGRRQRRRVAIRSGTVGSRVVPSCWPARLGPASGGVGTDYATTSVRRLPVGTIWRRRVRQWPRPGSTRLSPCLGLFLLDCSPRSVRQIADDVRRFGVILSFPSSSETTTHTVCADERALTLGELSNVSWLGVSNSPSCQYFRQETTLCLGSKKAVNVSVHKLLKDSNTGEYEVSRSRYNAWA